MTEQQKKILKEAYISEDLWDRCFIKDGMIFSPTESKTSEEVYQDYINKIDICEDKTKTLEELTKENEQLWETVQFLLKQVDLIPKEESE